jgi:hypothetical protein
MAPGALPSPSRLIGTLLPCSCHALATRTTFLLRAPFCLLTHESSCATSLSMKVENACPAQSATATKNFGKHEPVRFSDNNGLHYFTIAGRLFCLCKHCGCLYYPEQR